MPVADSLILLPALGCPAIAEWSTEHDGYRIYVSMLIVPTRDTNFGNAWLRRRLLTNELGLESFNNQTYYHIGTSWNEFGSLTHFSPDHIELLDSPPAHQKWDPQPEFLTLFRRKFQEAYRQRVGATRQPGGVLSNAHRVDFMLELPRGTSEGLYSLVSRSERGQILSNIPGSQVTINLILRNIPHQLGQRYPQNSNYDPVSNAFMDNNRMIVLHHPVYVPARNKEFMNVAHFTDTHVSRRWDAMHYWSRVRKTERRLRWRFYGPPSDPTIEVLENAERFLQYPQDRQDPQHRNDPDHWDTFNNPNRRFEEALESANNNDSVDIIIITGDLIDYNVGYRDIPGEHETENMNYLSHGSRSYFHNANWPLFYELLLKNYRKPVFTILGNHDYRWYYYGPMARGVGYPIFHFGAQNYAEALGINVDLNQSAENIEQDQRTALGLIYPPRLVDDTSARALDKSFNYIDWYNYAINPALDFCFRFRRMAFIFLDWRLGETTEPAARSMLTNSQMRMLEAFLTTSQGKTVLISMHASVFCTPTDRYNDGLLYEQTDPSVEDHLAQGTFVRHRGDFVRSLLRRRNAQTIVLSGHTHKNRIYIAGERGRLEGSPFYGTPVFNVEPEGRTGVSFPRNTTLFCVTTSTAYRKSRDNYRTPGYRIIEFRSDGGGCSTSLRSLSIPENQVLARGGLPTGHPNKT